MTPRSKSLILILFSLVILAYLTTAASPPEDLYEILGVSRYLVPPSSSSSVLF
jgi:hypothetical protein